MNQGIANSASTAEVVDTQTSTDYGSLPSGVPTPTQTNYGSFPSGIQAPTQTMNYGSFPEELIGNTEEIDHEKTKIEIPEENNMTEAGVETELDEKFDSSTLTSLESTPRAVRRTVNMFNVLTRDLARWLS
ncbi:hypothetical protein BDD12DRAFT_889897 [Trichophaea hybrida]|nr:hypothetical protein BDD12DRAFT_889897 [Trichophaea hybrida]